MSLQFTHVLTFSCRGRLRNLRADCSIVGLYCVTIIWQQIFKGSLQVTVERVLMHVTVERTHLGGLFSETATADSGKARSFILCGKKHG